MIDSLAKVSVFIFDFIRSNIFIVFGLYSIVYIICTFILKDKKKINKFDVLSCRLISFSGLIYFGCFLLLIIFTLCKGSEEKEMLTNRMFGPYWFAFFLPPTIYLIITQLLRIPKIRSSKVARLLFISFMLIPFEVYIIIITSLNRDYFPSSWNIYQKTSVFDVIIGFSYKFLLYLIFLGLFYMITERLKNRFDEPNKEIN